MVSTHLVAAGVPYDRPFSPLDGLVSRYEEPWREDICLNGRWKFQRDQNTDVPSAEAAIPGPWETTAIKIPSPWNINSFSMTENEKGGDFRTYPSYPVDWDKARAAWMEKEVTVPGSWAGRRIVLHFGAVAGKLIVDVNRTRVGEGFDIFFAQDFDVTKYIKFDSANEILIKVISPNVFDKPGRYGRREYLAGSFWGSHMAGVWQDVYLLAEPQTSIDDIFVQSWVNQDELRIEATVTNTGSAPAAFNLSGDVREWLNHAPKAVLDAPEPKWELGKTCLTVTAPEFALQPGESRTVTLAVKVAGRLKSWSPDSPDLYGLLLNLTSEGKTLDTKYQRFGWRQFTLSGNRLLLNGNPIVLRGDSWHFMGVPQMTRRYAYAWFALLRDAGANAVRLHASVYPSFYHDVADEMGIMILDESAIWLSDGGPKADSDIFWQNCRAHVTELVKRDRNHPSVFGWSVCNEVLPVLRNVWHAPDSMIEHCYDEITAWKNICLSNDPTRGWISGDGEWDANGRLPVVNIHYGDDGELQRAADSGKPFAVGETSMAYYGTPKQVSKFNGDRAYESDLGRMEGLAFECYHLLASQQKYGADYQSVFNIVWYGVQPLPLGKRDLNRPPTLDEGIFFGPFQEGVPGMQPERLGPYVSTLNPGYDPSLPLYRPWPMFEAIRDANLKKVDSHWANPPVLPAPSTPDVSTNGGQASLLCFIPSNANNLALELSKAGIKASVYSVAGKTDLLLLDGSQPEPGAELKDAIHRTLASGGAIWAWNVTPAGARALSELLGLQIRAEPRDGSSFIAHHNDGLLSGLDNADLYFSEDDNWKQMTYGLSGDFTNGASVVLEACPADWRRWNYKAEPVKTAALFRSELEIRSSRVAISVRRSGNGKIILCNLDFHVDSSHKAALLSRLFRNEGVRVDQIAYQNGFLDFKGRLVRALVCGSFAWTNEDDAYSSGFPAGAIGDGVELNGKIWKMRETSNGVFDFQKNLVEGPVDNAYAYIAVWIKSPKPLNDLLSEPNLPKLSFIYGADDGCEIWLNGGHLSTHDRHGPLDISMFSENPLLLKIGWNQLVIRVVQLGGEWKFAGRFECSDLTFLSKLEFATRRPVGE